AAGGPDRPRPSPASVRSPRPARSDRSRSPDSTSRTPRPSSDPRRRSSRAACRRDRPGAPSRPGLARRQLDHEAVAPAVLLLGERLHGARQPRLDPRVDNARQGGERAPAEPHGDTGKRAEIPDPLRALAMLGDQVEPARAAGEPALDLARPAGAPARR